jgi:hypothetical protein
MTLALDMVYEKREWCEYDIYLSVGLHVFFSPRHLAGDDKKWYWELTMKIVSRIPLVCKSEDCRRLQCDTM